MSARLSSASIHRVAVALFITSFTYCWFDLILCSPAHAFGEWMLDLPEGPDEFLFPNSHLPGPSIVTITWSAWVHRTLRWDDETFWMPPSLSVDPSCLPSRLCVPVRIRRKGRVDWKTALWTVFPDENPKLKLKVPGGDGYNFQPFIDAPEHLHPALVPYWMNLAEFYRKNCRYAEALAIYERTFPSLKGHHTVCYMSGLYRDTGRLGEIELALENYLRELENDKFIRDRTLSTDDVEYWIPRRAVPKESTADKDYWKTQAERLTRERLRALRDARRDILKFLLASYLTRDAQKASLAKTKLKAIDDEDLAERTSR